MRRGFTPRFSLVIRHLIAGLSVGIAPALFASPSSGFTPQTIAVDGINDFNPSNLVENDGGDTQTQNWCVSDPGPESPMDLGSVYVTNDANYLYIGLSYDPDCFRGQIPEMQFGMAIDRDPGTGGVNDPIGRKLQWPNPNASPEFILYDTYSVTNLEQLFQWNPGGMAWNTLVSGPNAIQIAEATTFIEARLPLAGLGLAPGMPIGLEFWMTRQSPTSGPLDAVCADPVQLSTPGGTTFSVAVPVSMQCLIPYVVQAPGGFISRAAATQLVIDNVILTGPNPSQVVGFLYHNTGSDSLLMPGSIVAPFDSSFIETIPMETFLFWLDDEPNTFFSHPVRFVLCDARTGILDVRAADNWPVVDGNQVLSFLEQGNASVDKIHGNYIEGGVLYEAEGVTQGPSDQWAIVFGGMNLKGAEDARAITGDGNRVKEILNSVPKGPMVPSTNITCVGTGDGTTTGASNDDICMAIDNIPDECGKLWVYIVSHGEGGYIVTRGPDGKPAKLPYKDLGMKLLGAKAKQVCIVIMACYSGSAVAVLDAASIGKGKDAETLKGKVVTSSSAGQPTDRDPDGSKYMKQLLACWKDCNADFDGSGKISLCEAHAWAVLQDPTVAGRGPQARDLEDGSTIVQYVQSLQSESSSTGATASLKYELVGLYYGRVKSGKVIKPVCRPVLYINNSSGSPTNMNKAIEIECFDERGMSLGRRPVPRMGFKAKERKCLFDLDPRCRSFRIHLAGKPGRLQARSETGVDPLLIIDSRSNTYPPGVTVFHVIPVTAADNDWLTATIVRAPAGWSLGTSPSAFLFPTAIDTQGVMIAGDVPDTATTGGLIVADIINHTTTDTLRIRIHAMVHDSVGVVLGPGPARRDQYLEMWSNIVVGSGTLDLGQSVVEFSTPGSVTVGPGGTLKADFTTFMSDSLRPWSCDIAGRIESSFTEWADATNGLVLDDVTGSIHEAAVFRSQGDGLTIRGPMDSLEINFALIDSCDGNGLVLDGVTDGYLNNVRVETSGQDDVLLMNSSIAELHDSNYDRLKETVAIGSQLTRSWDTGIAVSTMSGIAIPGAAITVTDALGATVADDYTDVDGFSNAWSLVQYIRNGGTVTDHTPHQVRVRLTAGLDTTIVVTADMEQTIEVAFPNVWMTGVPGGPPPPAFRLLPVFPNPFRAGADIRYSIPEEGHVRIAAYDVAGRLVDVLMENRQPAGEHTIRWAPRGLAAGSYYIRMESDGQASMRKVVRLP